MILDSNAIHDAVMRPRDPRSATDMMHEHRDQVRAAAQAEQLLRRLSRGERDVADELAELVAEHHLVIETPEPPVRWMRRARWGGECRECGARIERGDECAHVRPARERLCKHCYDEACGAVYDDDAEPAA